MPPMERIVLVEENTKEKGRYMGPLFLQGRALGPPKIDLFLQVTN
jgi:hypothetical protein